MRHPGTGKIAHTYSRYISRPSIFAFGLLTLLFTKAFFERRPCDRAGRVAAPRLYWGGRLAVALFYYKYPGGHHSATPAFSLRRLGASIALFLYLAIGPYAGVAWINLLIRHPACTRAGNKKAQALHRADSPPVDPRKRALFAGGWDELADGGHFRGHPRRPSRPGWPQPLDHAGRGGLPSPWFAVSVTRPTCAFDSSRPVGACAPCCGGR